MSYDADESWKVVGHASAYVVDPTTKAMSVFGTSNDFKLNAKPVTNVDKQFVVKTSASGGQCQCTFQGLDKAAISLNEDQTGLVTQSDGYKGYTFGFMPGYYSQDAATGTGKCNQQSKFVN